MFTRAGRLVAFSIAAFATACGSSTPTSPSSVPNGYSGMWTGQVLQLTLQAGTITFNVSQDQRVVSMTLNLGGCFGVRTFSGLSLPIEKRQLPPGSPNAGSAFDNPGFGYASGELDEPNFLFVGGAFTSVSSATGVVTFGEFQSCGNGVASWSATRR